MLIRRVFLIATGLVLTAGWLSAQTVADVARQNRAEKKAKRVFTSEDMVAAKPEVIATPPAAASKPAATSSKKKKNDQADAEAAATAAAAAAAEAMTREKAKFEEITSELTIAEQAVSEARKRAFETSSDPNASEAEKNSAKDAVEAADTRRKELNAAFLAQRKKAGADPKLDDAPPPPQTASPQ